MSEPVSDTDVEDVLASIRRLVSEDTRPARGAAAHALKAVTTMPEAVPEEVAPKAVEAPVPVPSDKLVLTPSLRVLDAAQEPEDDDKTVPLTSQDDGPHILTEASRADLPTETWVNQDQTDADEVDDTPVDADNAVVSEDIAQSHEQGAVEDHSDASPEGDEVRDELKDMHGEADELITESDDPSASAEDVYAVEAAQMQEAQPEHRSEQPQAEPVMADAPENPEPVRHPEMPEIDPTSLSAKIAALEAVIGRRQDEWEPDGSDEEEFIAQDDVAALQWEDHAPEPEAEPFVAQDPIRDVTPAVAQFVHREPEQPAAMVEETSATIERADDADTSGDDNEALIDEAALRDMVTEIVRQELQGTLGERITRNVRKLVRREIHRALTARELE